MDTAGKLQQLWLVDIPDDERKWIEKNMEAGRNVSMEIICMDANKAQIMLGGAENLFDKKNKSEISLRKEKKGTHNNIILISENQKIIDIAKKNNLPTIGYQPAGSDQFLHADMIAEGFEDADFTFFQRVYERHFHIPWTILETERCIVRELALSDLDALFSMYEEPGMTDYMEPLYDYETERDYQKAYIENMYEFYGYGMWLVFEKETESLIGRAGIEQREELDDGQELGYAIRPAKQGCGYAYEVCQAILSYAEHELGITKLHCLIQKGNTRSVRLAEKLGFTYEKERIIEEKEVSDFVKILTSR